MKIRPFLAVVALVAALPVLTGCGRVWDATVNRNDGIGFRITGTGTVSGVVYGSNGKSYVPQPDRITLPQEDGGPFTYINTTGSSVSFHADEVQGDVTCEITIDGDVVQTVEGASGRPLDCSGSR